MSDFRKPSETDPINDELDLETAEELDSKVHRAQEQLLELRRRQEQIEREKLRLEELSRKQEELEDGKAEMLEKLSRSLAAVQRETGECQKRLEQLASIENSFRQHLGVLEAISPKTWTGSDLAKELNKALTAVDDARAEYNKLLPKISPSAPAEEAVHAAVPDVEADYDETTGTQGFLYWLQAGFAFTLPLLSLGLIALLFWIYHLLMK